MRVVVIGSGIAAITFAEKFRTLAANNEIIVVTKETEGYYSKPLLSRGFSMAAIERTIILKSFDKLAASGIHMMSGVKVTAINRAAQVINIENSESAQTVAYDKLVLAPGSAAFIPPPLRPFQSMFYCLNSLVDLKKLRNFRADLLKCGKQPHWGIIGGGLIGCEIASDLAVAGDQVILFHRTDRLMERQLVADDSILLQQVLADSGVTVLLNQKVNGVARYEAGVSVLASNVYEVDGIIVCCGFLPRTELAIEAGLAADRGIKVDVRLSTSDPAISVLGDAAQLPDGKLYAYILPIRSQANWLAGFWANVEQTHWSPPSFTSKAKVHGFEARHPYTMP